MKQASVVGWVLMAWTALGCAPSHQSAELVTAGTNSAAQGAASSPANRATDTVKAQYVAERTESSAEARPKNPLDGARAYRYLQQICAIGPRISGSAGMQQQQELVRAHFEQLGGKVTLQKFQAANPLGGANVPLANVIVEWHPERKERILLCAHYDTRPLPDQDPNPVLQRTGVFIGANDGASGVAVLMELAHLMREFDGTIGVDFLLVDGEELVYVDGRDPYFLGSTWFAQQYVRQPPPHKYRWGVLLDMVGDSSLQIYQEQHSVAWRDTRPLVKEIWATAARLGVKEFMPRARYQVQDDHLPLRNIGKIPTCDIIDFDYPQWHTTMDTPRQCSPGSLAKVGWVVYEWLRGQGPRP
jgi:glutaminyl-peptide cyclotransferase